MPKRRAVVTVLFAVAAAALASAAWWSLHPSFFDVSAPHAGERIGLDGVEVLVHFRDAERVEPATFRALLNGADVTDGLEIASNGVHGRLHGLLEGPNRLRLEIFGRGRWPRGVLVEQVCELEVLYRPPSGIDRG
jgi:hypothetical protein